MVIDADKSISFKLKPTQSKLFGDNFFGQFKIKSNQLMLPCYNLGKLLWWTKENNHQFQVGRHLKITFTTTEVMTLHKLSIVVEPKKLSKF